MSVSLTDEVAMADNKPPDSELSSPYIPGSEIQPQFVNRFHVYVDALHTRIIFGDAVVGITATFHSSIVMTTANATELAELLTKLIKQNQSTAKA